MSGAVTALKRRIHAKTNDLNARGLFYSSEYGYQINLLKEQSLHAYRDELREAERDVARLFDREGLLHGAWRRVRRRPRYKLSAPSRVRPVLDAWREPAKRHLKEGEEPKQLVDDPTSRTLDQTIASLASAPKAFG